jgi:mRNA interferase RelE/StbE
VRVSEEAIRDLAGLSPDVRRRLWNRIEPLAENPRPASSRRLTGSLRGLCRLRVGDYRVAYTIDDSMRIIDVLRAGHRATFCRRLRGMSKAWGGPLVGSLAEATRGCGHRRARPALTDSTYASTR